VDRDKGRANLAATAEVPQGMLGFGQLGALLGRRRDVARDVRQDGVKKDVESEQE
jgi:hypothetical protein